MSNFKENLGEVKAFVFDVDGVFTDGKLYVNPDGEYIRSMNIKDGYAVQHAVKQGYIVGIITGGNTESVKVRFNSLGITDVYMKSMDKMEDFKDFYFKYDLDPQDILYMGDDIPDYEVMAQVGFPTCPANAVEEIKSISKYISDVKGGEGCVRDVIEQVMKLHGKWVAEK